MFANTVVAAQAQKESAPIPEHPTSVYKIDYVFYEVQDGKRMNVRNYTTLLGWKDRGSIRLGDRVPVRMGTSGKEDQVTYMDIGVNIDSRIEQEVEAGVALFTNIDISSVAPEQPGENRNGLPVVRQMKFQLEEIVPLGKQTLIGSADEVDGVRRIEIQATATKVR
jgi:hypothetical protein